MSDTPSKLGALGELLGVQDDTRDLERTIEPRPAVGEVLRGNTTDRTTHEPEEAPSDAAPGPAPPGEPTAAQRPRTDRRTKTTTSVAAPARPTSDRHRTSANIPVALLDRLADAKRRRWELSDLVASAVAHTEIDDVAADDLLENAWNTTRVQRAYQLSPDDLARIGALGERWRMNRSQVLTVILPGELDRLGL